jgi:hypothetical protein
MLPFTLQAAAIAAISAAALAVAPAAQAAQEALILAEVGCTSLLCGHMYRGTVVRSGRKKKYSHRLQFPLFYAGRANDCAGRLGGDCGDVHLFSFARRLGPLRPVDSNFLVRTFPPDCNNREECFQCPPSSVCMADSGFP